MRPADPRPFVPVEPEPSQPVENAFDHFGRRALDVGVFDAQHEHAAVPAGEQPVEQRRARAADVEVAGRRRSETDAWGWHRRALMQFVKNHGQIAYRKSSRNERRATVEHQT